MNGLPQHSVSVAAVITDDAGRVLLLERADSGEWQIPGGVLELEESVTDGLVREVREETGLTVEPDRLTGIYKHLRRGIVALVFRAKVTGGSLTEGPEARQLAWVDPDEAVTRMAEVFAVRVTDATADATTVAIREHDGRTLQRPARASSTTTG